MLNLGDIKLGTIIKINNEPYQVVSASHTHMGRGKAVMQTKLKNLISGKVIEQSFKDGDRIEEADLSRKNVQFLYIDGDDAFFMDNESFETTSLPIENIGEDKQYLKEGLKCQLMISNGKPVKVELPIKISYKVVSAPPGVKGDTASGATKPATIETGAIVQVPLFIKEGDMIKVNTTTGEYVERA